MNLNQLSNILQSPALITEQDVQMLKELCSKYPYSQLFSIVYLKALHTSKDVYFDDELEKHAYKITDRTKLHQLINQRIEFEQTNKDVPDPLVENITETLETAVLNNDELILTDKDKSHEIKEEKNEDLIEVKVAEQANRNEKSLELEILTNAAQTVYNEEFEVSSVILEETASSVLTNTPEKDKSLSIKVNSDDTLKITPTTKKKFSDWLNISSIDTNNPQINDSAKTKEEIINKFIDTSPTISTLKKEFYSPIKQGQQSIDADQLIYTETLASILALQGNFPKAIIAYEQLILTNSEKKIYFAEKIKELKNKLNQNS